jgi:hypothetical protein
MVKLYSIYGLFSIVYKGGRKLKRGARKKVPFEGTE